MKKEKVVKTLFLVVGTLSFVLGTIGIFLPVMPTVPFYLVTLYAYNKGSKRMHNWFISTKLYEKYLSEYDKNKGISLKKKVILSILTTISFGISFIFLRNILIAKVSIIVLWSAFMIAIIFIVKTIEEDKN